MSEYLNSISNTKSIFSNKLIVGNHDTITLYGIQAQNSLKDFSRRMSDFFLNEKEELDVIIAEVLVEIKDFDKIAQKTSNLLFAPKMTYKNILNKYRNICMCLDDMTSFFKIQEARIIKEITMYDNFLEKVESCSTEILNCIEECKVVLDNRNIICTANKDEPLDYDGWYKRLEKRICDLQVSHTIALQSEAQIKILHNAKLTMFEELTNLITNTFPIWKKQIAIMFGSEIIERRLYLASEINNNKKIRSLFKRENKGIVKISEINLNIDDIQKLNQDLSISLNRIFSLKKAEEKNRKELFEKHNI